MSDFSADTTPAQNGAGPFASRGDDAQFGSGDPAPAHAAAPGSAPAAPASAPAAPASAPAAPASAPAPGPASGPSSVPASAAPSASSRSSTPVHAPTGPPSGPQRLAAVVKGRIDVADEVVEKVAGLAALEVEGVADVGGDLERAFETVRERIGIGNKRGDQGIKARIQGREVAIDVTIMIEYGHVVLDTARQVQSNVAVQTNRMLGLNVVEVNVNVDDVRMPRPPERDEDDTLRSDGGVISIEG